MKIYGDCKKYSDENKYNNLLEKVNICVPDEKVNMANEVAKELQILAGAINLFDNSDLENVFWEGGRKGFETSFDNLVGLYCSARCSDLGFKAIGKSNNLGWGAEGGEADIFHNLGSNSCDNFGSGAILKTEGWTPMLNMVWVFASIKAGHEFHFVYNDDGNDRSGTGFLEEEIVSVENGLSMSAIEILMLKNAGYEAKDEGKGIHFLPPDNIKQADFYLLTSSVFKDIENGSKHCMEKINSGLVSTQVQKPESEPVPNILDYCNVKGPVNGVAVR